jgi:chloramphenicol-sensitive protein RarD
LSPISSRGLAHGIAAYSCWGLFPLYWKMLTHVPALEVLAHRIVWSCVLLIALVEWRRRRGTPWPSLSARVIATYAVAAVLIGVNWFLYVWAVTAGLVLQTSLGYFITPLVSVVFGVAMFGERLRALQWAAVAVASLGMLYLAFGVGGVPWVSLGLATSFGAYSIVKKTATLGAIEGLTLETVILWLPAAALLALLASQDGGAFMRSGLGTDLLLVVGGLVTIVPLLLFASSLRLIPLSTIGILQYISPSLQFLLGVLLYHEPFDHAQLVGFVAVWAALAGFTVDSLWSSRALASRRLERVGLS